MKSTYSLLSIYLDGVPLPKSKLPVITELNENSIYEVGEAKNLFDDAFGYVRYISAEKLLEAKDSDKLYNLFKNNDCANIVIVTDFSVADEIIFANLYAKRILQIVSLLRQKFDFSFFLFIGQEYLSMFENLMGDFIKL